MIKSKDYYDSLYCNNCGKRGHTYNQCSKPITSIGIIAINKEYNNIKFLIICRKDSLGYVEFLRGKYNITDKNYIQNLINEMTKNEKNRLQTIPFQQLWNDLWGNFNHSQYKSEEKMSRDKIENIKKGINDLYTKEKFTLEDLINNSTTNWEEPEWGFPKGRRNYNETDINCALREFEEETGYNKKDIRMIINIKPVQEVFTGSNYKSYKHKYFLGHIDNPKKPINFQKSEVSQLKWLSLEECLKVIRPYSFEKIEIIKKIDKILNKYSLLI